MADKTKDNEEQKKCYLCKSCSKSFNHAGNRRRHERKCENASEKIEIEKPKPIFHCANSWCGHSFDRKANFLRHLTICSKKSEGSKTCFVCKKVFSRSTHLRRHIQSHTSRTNKKLKCPNCNVVFIRHDKYNKHILACNNIVGDTFATMVNNDHSTVNHKTFDDDTDTVFFKAYRIIMIQLTLT